MWINAEKLKEELSKAPVWTTLAIVEMIDQTAKEMPKRGEWIDKGNWMGIECSRCKCHSRYVTPFCPQCGARMKGADDA